MGVTRWITRAGLGMKALGVVFLLALAAVYWVALSAPAIGMFHDDGVLLVTAKALAEGDGYRIVSLPDEIAQTKYPPLFPAVLAALWRLAPAFPGNLLLLKLAPLAFSILWFWFVWRLVELETGSRRAGAVIALLTCASPWVVFLGTSLLSDNVFACLATGSLLYLRSVQAGPEKRAPFHLAVAAVLAGLAFLTRTAALPLMAAGAMALLWRKRFRHAGVFLLICALFVTPWLVWQGANGPEQSISYRYYSSQNYQDWNLLASYEPAQKLEVVARNVLFVVMAPIFFFGLPASVVGLALALAFAGFALRGFLPGRVSGITVTHLFVGMYGAMLLLWAWIPVRFLIPLMPLLAMFVFQGARGVVHGGSAMPVWRRTLGWAAVAVAVVGLGVAQYESTQRARTSEVYYPNELLTDDWGQMRDLLEWVKANTPPEAVIASNLDPVVYLYTGRKALRAFTVDAYQLHYSGDPSGSLGSAETYIEQLAQRGVTHVLVMPNGHFSEIGVLNPMIERIARRDPAVLRPVHASRDRRYGVYEVSLEAIRKHRALAGPAPSAP